MAQFDILIKNGLLIDGSGASPVHASVGINEDKISFIGFLTGEESATHIIDAQGYP